LVGHENNSFYTKGGFEMSCAARFGISHDGSIIFGSISVRSNHCHSKITQARMTIDIEGAFGSRKVENHPAED
jgi:hypothetical protein